jgi:hypothetical protein
VAERRSCLVCGGALRSDNLSGFCQRAKCKAAYLRERTRAVREGRTPQPRACAVCGGRLNVNNLVGIDQRTRECKRASERAHDQRKAEREQAEARAQTRARQEAEAERERAELEARQRAEAEREKYREVAGARAAYRQGPDTPSVAAARRWRQAYESGRRARGVPEEGYGPAYCQEETVALVAQLKDYLNVSGDRSWRQIKA